MLNFFVRLSKSVLVYHPDPEIATGSVILLSGLGHFIELVSNKRKSVFYINDFSKQGIVVDEMKNKR